MIPPLDDTIDLYVKTSAITICAETQALHPRATANRLRQVQELLAQFAVQILAGPPYRPIKLPPGPPLPTPPRPRRRFPGHLRPSP